MMKLKGYVYSVPRAYPGPQTKMFHC